jgi:hypothetical protein
MRSNGGESHAATNTDGDGVPCNGDRRPRLRWTMRHGTRRGPDPSVASALQPTEDQRAVIESLHEAFEEEFRPLRNQLLSRRSELAR